MITTESKHRIRDTVKCASLSSHFNRLLTRSPKNKSFKVEVGEDNVSTTDLHVESFTSDFAPIPRTSDVAKASYVASRLQNKRDAIRWSGNILS